MIERNSLRAEVETALRRAPVCYLAGPRQVGKTTLARSFMPEDSADYYDLEDPLALRLLEEPMTTLAARGKLVVIDEIQRLPGLFPALRVLVDRDPDKRFLILGSAAPELLKGVSESLAGRVERVPLGGFGLEELGWEAVERLWARGGFPRSYLAASEADSRAWRANFILSMTERDLPRTGLRAAGPTLHRFWTMIAHAQGGVWNAADPARALGFSETTVKNYLDALEGLFLVRVLRPWHENLAKRQVRSPKVYVRDVGIYHQLLGIRDRAELLAHPKLGASWEGFVIEELLKLLRPDEAYFWATHAGAELDLFALKDGRRLGFEIKRADAPSLTPSMRVALADLRLDELTVIYPGERTYRLAEKVLVMPIAGLGEMARLKAADSSGRL